MNIHPNETNTGVIDKCIDTSLSCTFELHVILLLTIVITVHPMIRGKIY